MVVIKLVNTCKTFKQCLTPGKDLINCKLLILIFFLGALETRKILEEEISGKFQAKYSDNCLGFSHSSVFIHSVKHWLSM